ncbi:hypothetical protein G3M48_001269, partial [Beauveria asiatica]
MTEIRLISATAYGSSVTYGARYPDSIPTTPFLDAFWKSDNILLHAASNNEMP